jgi:hypothetical protein
MPVTWLTPTTPAHGLEEPEEIAHTVQEQWTNDKLSATVGLKCPWMQRHDTMANLLIFAKLWPYDAGYKMRAVSGSILPFGQNPQDYLDDVGGHGLKYDHAHLTVNFETADVYEHSSGAKIIYSEEISPTAEMLTLPPDKIRWSNPTTGKYIKPEEAPSMLQVGFDYGLTYYNLSSVPTAFLNLTGLCNNDFVPSSFFGVSFPLETLLYNPPTVSRSVSLSASASRYTLRSRLTFKSGTWNRFWNIDTGNWEYMYRDGDPNPIKNYPPSNFAGILPNGILP